MSQELPLKTQMLNRIRSKGMSEETFKTYWFWCEKFFRFVKDQTGDWKHPRECECLLGSVWFTGFWPEKWRGVGCLT